MKVVAGIFATCLMAIGALAASSETKSLADLQEATAAARRVKELKETVATAKAKANQAFKEAAKIRQRGNIIDPDPTSTDAPTASADQNSALHTAYLAAKKQYLDWVNSVREAEAALASAQPLAELHEQIAKARDEADAAHEKLKKRLESGLIQDPDPNDPGSTISVSTSDKNAAASYADQKARYLAAKARLKKTEEALESMRKAIHSKGEKAVR